MSKTQDIHEALEVREHEYFKTHKNRIIESDELSRKQKEELGVYLRYKLGKSDSNRETTKADLGRLTTIFEFCFDKDVDVTEPSIEEIRKMSAKMNELKEHVKEMSDYTYNDYIQTLRNYYHNNDKENNEAIGKILPQVPNNPPDQLHKIQHPQRKNEVPRLSTEDIVKLIKSASNPRDACLLGLYVELGSRPSELGEVTVNDVNMRGWKGGPEAEINVKVKKNEGLADRKMIVNRTYPELESWMKMRKRIDTSTDRLFVNLTDRRNSEKGTAMTGNNMNQRIKKIGEKLGYDLTRSKLRNISVDYWFGNSGYGPNELKRKFGWKDFDRIRTYDGGVHTNLEEARRREDGLPNQNHDYFAMQDCMICGFKNSPTQVECRVCGSPLDMHRTQNTNGSVIKKLTETVQKNSTMSREEAYEQVNSIMQDSMAGKFKKQETDLRHF